MASERQNAWATFVWGTVILTAGLIFWFDRLGRIDAHDWLEWWPLVFVAGLAVFAVASLGCAASHSIEYLWAFRMLQGVSAGAGIVIGRAIIRDLYSGARATRLLSLVTMIFSIAPAIAPILGGWIVKLRDWRAIFLFLFLYTALVDLVS